MSLDLLTDAAAVNAAIDEYDALTGDVFLQKYGFGRSCVYYVNRSGKLYESKAIAGVAVGKQHSDRGPLRSSEFSGGEETVGRKLRSLGFDVIPKVPEASTPATQPAPKKAPGGGRSPVNLILYGPPGTGKTYATAERAVELCDGSAPQGRDAIMHRYAELAERGRIRFVTFHQSYAYEDFVEGLRPETGDADDQGEAKSGGFSLTATPGVFRRIARSAQDNLGQPLGPIIDLTKSRKVFKLALGRSSDDDDASIYRDAMDGGYVVLGWGGDIDWSPSEYQSFEAIKARWQRDHPDATGYDPNIAQLYVIRAGMEVGDLVIVPYPHHDALGSSEGRLTSHRVQGTEDTRLCAATISLADIDTVAERLRHLVHAELGSNLEP
jgi:hypothetical protein